MAARRSFLELAPLIRTARSGGTCAATTETRPLTHGLGLVRVGRCSPRANHSAPTSLTRCPSMPGRMRVRLLAGTDARRTPDAAQGGARLDGRHAALVGVPRRSYPAVHASPVLLLALCVVLRALALATPQVDALASRLFADRGSTVCHFVRRALAARSVRHRETRVRPRCCKAW